MEILGIGMPELIFIFIIAIIVMGPKDMQKAGNTIGKWLRNLVTSDGWKIFQQTSRELRTLPNKLMREANEELEQINRIGKDMQKPIDTSDMKYPAPAKSKPVVQDSIPVAGNSGTSEADIKSSPLQTESKEDESDPKKDA